MPVYDHIYQHNQTNLDFLYKRATHGGYSIFRDLIKLLTTHGVDGGTARKVVARIQHKVQRHAQLTVEEKALVHEYIAKTATNLSKANQAIPPGGDRRIKWSDHHVPVPAKNRGYKEGDLNDYVHRLSTRGKFPAVKMDTITKKPGKSAMIRQLAYRIASH